MALSYPATATTYPMVVEATTSERYVNVDSTLIWSVKHNGLTTNVATPATGVVVLSLAASITASGVDADNRTILSSQETAVFPLGTSKIYFLSLSGSPTLSLMPTEKPKGQTA